MYDHDWPDLAIGVAIPHGLYDLKLNVGYLYLCISHDTSELACDGMSDWWQQYGSQQYGNAESISGYGLMVVAIVRVNTFSNKTYNHW